jgi:hypothetical protein
MKWVNAGKIVGIASMGLLLMANQKCEQKEISARQLKKNVRVMGFQASSFLDASGFKFSEVAQSQLGGVIFDSSAFFERTTYPSATQMTSGAPGLFKATYSDGSARQLKTWFPQMKLGDVELTRESACLISRPQHLLFGKINALEAHSGGKLQFGFNSTSALLPKAEFKLDRMRMDLSMHAFDPWTQQRMASVNEEAIKSDYAASFGINLGIIHIGPQFYRHTGMAEVTLAGLKKVVASMVKRLAGLDRQEWQTRVMVSRDNYVVIVGGAELGLKKGDQLKVENEIHDWIGEPCGESSALGGSVSVTSDPWIVEIEEAGNLMAKAKVLNPHERDTINVGALVRVEKLFVPPPAPASK